MDELLTVNQVRGLLKVDRQTVYRMLKDGRLNAVKIGHEWRFSRHEVDNLLSGLDTSSTALVTKPNHTGQPGTSSQDDLPIHCVQLIERLFTDIAGVSMLTLSTSGEPLTEISGPCKFCRLMLASASGRQACAESWQKIASHHTNTFATCHAGLQYLGAPVEIDGKVIGKLVTGEYYVKAPQAGEESARIRGLAKEHGIDHTTLGRAAVEIHVLSEQERERLHSWLKSVALAIESIGRERADLVARLRSIAAISGM